MSFSFVRRRVVKTLGASLTALVGGPLASVAARAATEPWPSKPLKLVVGFPAGASTDAMGRVVAEGLSGLLGQRMVVENRPGAAGNIAAQYVATAPPDGYTLLWTHIATHGIAPAVYEKIPYDPVRDFTPVSLIATAPLILLGNPAVPVNTVGELITYAKTLNRPLTVGTPGNGTSSHLSLELLKQRMGVNLQHVPYKGGAPAMADLLGGQIDLVFTVLDASTPPFVQTKRIKAFGVTTLERSPLMPDTPTLAESGLPGFSVYTWWGIVAPAGTPDAVVARLAEASVEMVRMPEIRKKFAEASAVPVGSSPAKFTEWIRDQLDHWGKVARAANIRVD